MNKNLDSLIAYIIHKLYNKIFKGLGFFYQINKNCFLYNSPQLDVNISGSFK